MRRATAVLAILMAATPALVAGQTLKGVWRGTAQVAISETGETEVVEFTQPRILIYTDAYFAWAFEPEDPRPLGASDAEVAAAARAYNSAAGTYIRDGVDIIYNRRVATNPNGRQAAAQPLVRQIRVLTATTLVTQLTNADGVTTLLVYERAE
ncbi:MAG: hypothetical protein PVJ80_16635 [Gemmatimonadota bacterium]|jgi:hypothetical protein